MAFNIPQGKNFTFSITVLAQNSFLPQDLANLDLTNTLFELMNLDTLVKVVGACTISKIVDSKVNPTDPDTYLNGKISITIPSSITSTLAFSRGPKVDDYYPIPTYEGIVTIAFTDSTPGIVAIVKDICIVPTGA